MHGDSSIEHTKAGVIGTTMFVLELICFNVHVFVLDLVDSSIFTNILFYYYWQEDYCYVYLVFTCEANTITDKKCWEKALFYSFIFKLAFGNKYWNDMQVKKNKKQTIVFCTSLCANIDTILHIFVVLFLVIQILYCTHV